MGKEPGLILEEGERGGGGTEPSLDGNNSKLNLKGHSLEIHHAAVRGIEQHHPIMNKLGGLGNRTHR